MIENNAMPAQSQKNPSSPSVSTLNFADLTAIKKEILFRLSIGYTKIVFTNTFSTFYSQNFIFQ